MLESDAENLDPVLFAKRFKAPKAAETGTALKDLLKPSSCFTLTRADAKSLRDVQAKAGSPQKGIATSPRHFLPSESPAPRHRTRLARSSPVVAPAGRSPTLGKRAGILSSRRRISAPLSHVDPRAFAHGSAAPFSLDAALRGTIPGYGSCSKMPIVDVPTNLHEPEVKASWFFDIHEDTPEQEMTNLLQHSTCVLDISSDEETRLKARRDKDEGRDKENVPPMDDISQTSARSAPRLRNNEMDVEKQRVALGEMDPSSFYADDCVESSVIIVPGDEDDQTGHVEQLHEAKRETALKSLDFLPDLDQFGSAHGLVSDLLSGSGEQVDALMAKTEDGSSKAAVLKPLDGTGDAFELWESGSSKGEEINTASS